MPEMFNFKSRRHDAVSVSLIIAVVLMVIAMMGNEPQTTSAQGSKLALRFYGHGTGDIDRVKIPIVPAVPANIGATDFTFEFWIKANAGANTGTATCGVDDGWITANIIFDRDVFGSGDYGDYGISLNAGQIAFGVNNGSSGTTLCGTVNIANGAWHHVAITRNVTTGAQSIFVDGLLDVQANSPAGNISYRVGRTTSYPNSDPFLVIGAEKHDMGSAYLSFDGWVDEVRLSNTLRYTANFTPSNVAFTTDANTMALYHFNEGPAGNCTGTILDSSGASGGPSNGACSFGGLAPAGPVYTTDNPFGTATAVVLTDVRATGSSDHSWLLLGMGSSVLALAVGLWWRYR